MRRSVWVPACLCLCSTLGAGVARADPIVIGQATIAPTGRFDCRSSIKCVGEGTNSITFGSGDNTATLTFIGATSTFDVTNQRRPVTLGEFVLDASEGFTFPTHPANPTGQPFLRFNIALNQTGLASSRAGKQWQFGPGGLMTARVMMGTAYFVTSAGSNTDYGLIVYRTRPFPFTIGPGRTALTADVGAVPEPASMVLLGTGLAGLAGARLRRKRGNA